MSLPEPIRALSEFYHAFNTRDIEAMPRNWASTDEVSMDNPVGGIRDGWEEIRPVYERIFRGPAKVYVEFYDYTIHQSGDTFYTVGRERGEFSIGGSTIRLAIRTTRVFRRVSGDWKQVHHHGSIEDPELLRQYQQALLSARSLS